MELLPGVLARGVRGHPVPQVDALGRPRRRPSGGPCSGSSRSLGDEVVAVAFAGVRSGRELARAPLPRARDVRGDEPRTRTSRSSASATCSSTATSARDDDGARRRRGEGRRRRRTTPSRARRRERVARRGAARRHRLVRPGVPRAPGGGHPRRRARAPEVLLRPDAATTSSFPNYLAVVNTANRPDLIAKGNDRVMRARLADARFFWEEDKKRRSKSASRSSAGSSSTTGSARCARRSRASSASRAHRGRGSGRARMQSAAVARAARLCKCDLVSLMVGEFPELQGHMGRAYALAQGETARRRRRHPRSLQAGGRAGRRGAGRRGGGHRARRPVRHAGRLLRGRPRADGRGGPVRAAARVHRRAAHAARPRATRRSPSRSSCALAYDGFEGKKLDLSRAETVAKIEEFATERLRGLLASATSNAGRRRACSRATGRGGRSSNVGRGARPGARAPGGRRRAGALAREGEASSPSGSRASAARRSRVLHPRERVRRERQEGRRGHPDARARPRRRDATALDDRAERCARRSMSDRARRDGARPHLRRDAGQRPERRADPEAARDARPRRAVDAAHRGLFPADVTRAGARRRPTGSSPPWVDLLTSRPAWPHLSQPGGDPTCGPDRRNTCFVTSCSARFTAPRSREPTSTTSGPSPSTSTSSRPQASSRTRRSTSTT